METEMMMPPAGIGAETDEDRQRRLRQNMPPGIVEASSPTPRIPTMPPAGLPAIPRSTANAVPSASAVAMPPATLPQISSTDARSSEGRNAGGSAEGSERFGHLDENVRQSFLRRAASAAEKARSESARTPALSGDAVRAAMAAASRPSGPANAGMDPSNAMPPGAALAQPSMPPAGRAEMAAPDVQKMPPAQVGPQQQAYNELSAKGEPKLSGWKKVLDTIGSIFPIGRAVETAIPGSPQNYDFKLGQAGMRAAKEQMIGKGEQEAETASAQAQFNTPAKRETYMQQHPEQFEDMTDFERNDWRVTGKFPQREPAQKTARPENLDREAYDYYVGQGMTPADARKRVLQDAQSVKPERQTHTSAFEAFAYGSPEEKKAAQDYLEFEKKVGARYKTPSEFDEKFRLFKEDPDTYKAMFGDKDKSGAPDRATARAMLNYFDRRRREINQDFTLDDQQKAQQLQDIERLEKPFMDAVQPGAGGGPTNTEGGAAHPGDTHRVRVISPDGKEGTVPLRQLKDAKKKGYRVAP